MKKNSRGIFKQENNGKWMIDTTIKVNDEYKHFRRRGYSTLSEARADYEIQKAQFLKEMRSANITTMLFEDLIDKYKEMRKHRVDMSTLVADNSIYNVYLLPYFEGKLIKEVFNQNAILNWYDNLISNNNYSDNKKNKVITRIKDILLFSYNNRYIDAETYQLCDTNIFQVKYNKKPKRERCIWSSEEEKLFVDATKENDKDYLMFRLFLLCATRISEFLALQVKCFDRTKNRIIIEQQVKNVTGVGMVTVNKLKSQESHRTIIITPELSDLLCEYIDTFNLKENDYLFYGVSSKKEPMSKNTFRRKLYYYCDKANVEKLVPHEIRHNMAVKLARICKTTEDIEVCASRLGHTPSVFLDIYANHKDDNKQLELMNKMLNI